MADRIALTGLEATGYHGVFDHEKRDGQRFVTDITCWLDFPDGDELQETVDYGELAELAVGVVTGPPVDLIETVASAIAERAMARFEQLHAIEVTIHKPDAPIEHRFGDVAVTARRSRKRLRGREA